MPAITEKAPRQINFALGPLPPTHTHLCVQNHQEVVFIQLGFICKLTLNPFLESLYTILVFLAHTN